MHKDGLADVFRILVYIIISFLLAAIISPLLFKVGKNFAEVFANKDTTDSLTWLGKKAARAEFDTYFKRSLMLAALLGLWPLVHSLKANRPMGQESLWRTLFRKPNSGNWLTGPKQTVVGFLISAGIFLLMTLFIQFFEWRIWDAKVALGDIPSLALKSLQPAITVSLTEEIFFRGFLMAIFLRAFRPSLAVIALSLLFASVHFLQPESDTTIPNPYALTAGFEMLSLIGQRFLEPNLIIASFTTLFATGLILGFARYRTNSLWLPLGVHAGWVFTLKLYRALTDRHSDHPDGAGIYLGDSTLEGILPLGALVLTGILIALYLRKSPRDETPSP